MANETQAEVPQISIADLQNVLRIIDVSAERGTFKGNELSAVGGIRDKLSAFLEAVTPKEDAPASTPDAPAAPAADAAAS